LCARIPDGVTDDCAAFTVLAAIGLEGVRLAQVSIGESVVVIGLGLIGLITVELLRAQGCRVLGVDFDATRLALAEQFGATAVNLGAGQDPIREAERFSHGRGVDAVLITAATKSSEPVHQAALMCRKRGRIVLVGVTGLALSRDDFYKKELSFQVSCSYGPGRYDPSYESGLDYPQAFVRWTAQRNFEAVLALLAAGQLQFQPLVSHRFSFERSQEAYELMNSREAHLGIVLEYRKPCEQPDSELLRRSVDLGHGANQRSGKPVIAFIGAGGYSRKTLLPAFRATGADLRVIVSNGGVSAAHAGRKFGFQIASSDPARAFADPEVDTVVVATGHDSHARYVIEALRAGKNVFVEKPLALTEDEISAIEEAYWDATGRGQSPRLMVGFNRRFAPQVAQMKALLANVTDPKTVVITVNAGGGRLVDEGCHFVDLMRFLVGSPAIGFHKALTGGAADTASVSIAYEDGSMGILHYLASGHKSFPKERVEVFCAGKILQLDNFRTLRGWGWPAFRVCRLWEQDKGAKRMTAAFVEAIQNGLRAPISFEEIVETSRFTLRIAAS
jgi:predicted dehydrogenase/NADPH:quinone reductase-like Zn-dependent oxidoreductase